MFVPNSQQGNRRDTAVLLTGTADEYDLPQRDIKVVNGGFEISDDLAEALGLSTEDESAEDENPYSDWEYADLKHEVAERGLDTENQKATTLAAALLADDEAAEADESDDTNGDSDQSE